MHPNSVFFLCLWLSCVQPQAMRFDAYSTSFGLTRTIPDWLFNVKGAVIQAIEDPSWGGYKPTEGVVPEILLKLKLEKMDILSIDALEYDLWADNGFIGVNITDLRMTMRIYFEELRLMGLLDLRVNDSLGNSFVDAFVTGGLRAGYEISKESNDVNEVCDEADRLLVFPQLHMRAGFNWIDRLVPAIDKVVRMITCWIIKSKLSVAKEFLIMKHLSAINTFIRGHSMALNATKALVGPKFFHVKKTKQAIHLGEKCARKGCSNGGTCDYCGAGYCCKKGSFAGGCNGVDGDPRNFVCVEAPPEQRNPQNLGNECWNTAKCRSGRCGYCGSGFCCRLGVHGGHCSGEVGTSRNHVCVPVPYANETEKENYRNMLEWERFWENIG